MTVLQRESTQAQEHRLGVLTKSIDGQGRLPLGNDITPMPLFIIIRIGKAMFWQHLGEDTKKNIRLHLISTFSHLERGQIVVLLTYLLYRRRCFYRTFS